MNLAPTPQQLRARRQRRILLSAIVVPGILLLYSCAVEPYWLKLSRHEVGAGSGSLRILHLSDLHFTTAGSRERRILEIVKEENPDLIVLTGDGISSGFDSRGFEGFLSSLEAPQGVFACEGNWEDWVPTSLECYRRGRVRILDRDCVKLGDGVELLGPALSRSEGPAALRIALAHYPDVLPSAAARGIDLVLAGHTHGGQVRLPFLGALHTPFKSGGFESGWYQEGDTRMFVSRGIGVSIFPLRFLCRPEVALLHVRFEPRP